MSSFMWAKSEMWLTSLDAAVGVDPVVHQQHQSAERGRVEGEGGLQAPQLGSAAAVSSVLTQVQDVGPDQPQVVHRLQLGSWTEKRLHNHSALCRKLAVSVEAPRWMVKLSSSRGCSSNILVPESAASDRWLGCTLISSLQTNQLVRGQRHGHQSYRLRTKTSFQPSGWGSGTVFIWFQPQTNKCGVGMSR